MEDRYDSQIYTLYAQVRDSFSYIENIPVAAAVVDLEENYIIGANSIFSELFKLKNFPVDMYEITNYDFSDFIDEIEIKKANFISADSETVMLHTADGEKINADIRLRPANNSKLNLAVMTVSERIAKGLKIDGNKTASGDFGFSDIQIFKSLADGLYALVYVYDIQAREMVYLNEYTRKFFEGSSNEEIINKLGMNIDVKSADGEVMSYEKSIGEDWFKMSEINIWEGNRVVRLGIGIDVTDTKKEEKKNFSGSLKDSLTGIYNKIAGFGKLQDCIDCVKQEGGMFSLCYIDINKLNYVNGNLGMAEGDRYIKNVVETVKKVIRRSDLFARVGGDEFIVVLTQCPPLTASRIMESINEKLEELSFKERKAYKHSVSYGVIEVNDEKELNLEELVQKAENQMLRAKFNSGAKN